MATQSSESTTRGAAPRGSENTRRAAAPRGGENTRRAAAATTTTTNKQTNNNSSNKQQQQQQQQRQQQQQQQQHSENSNETQQQATRPRRQKPLFSRFCCAVGGAGGRSVSQRADTGAGVRIPAPVCFGFWLTGTHLDIQAAIAVLPASDSHCHRSHFGSRYKLGCCGHAGLFLGGRGEALLVAVRSLCREAWRVAGHWRVLCGLVRTWPGQQDTIVLITAVSKPGCQDCPHQESNLGCRGHDATS